MGGYVAQLVVDPTGSAHTRTLSAPIARDWPEREVSCYRQRQADPTDGWSRFIFRASNSRVSGTLRLTLTLADRQWLQSHFVSLARGDTLRVYPDSTDASEYTDLILKGDEVEERYARVIAGRSDAWWTIDLPVVLL